jgi:hypothetical protein
MHRTGVSDCTVITFNHGRSFVAFNPPAWSTGSKRLFKQRRPVFDTTV